MQDFCDTAPCRLVVTTFRKRFLPSPSWPKNSTPAYGQVLTAVCLAWISEYYHVLNGVNAREGETSRPHGGDYEYSCVLEGEVV